MLERELGIMIVNRIGDFIDQQKVEYDNLKQLLDPNIAEEGPFKGYKSKVIEYESKFNVQRHSITNKNIKNDFIEFKKNISQIKPSQALVTDKKMSSEKEKVSRNIQLK